MGGGEGEDAEGRSRSGGMQLVKAGKEGCAGCHHIVDDKVDLRTAHEKVS